MSRSDNDKGTDPLSAHLPRLDEAAVCGLRLIHNLRLKPLWQHLFPEDRLEFIPSNHCDTGHQCDVKLHCAAGAVELNVSTMDEELWSMASAGSTDGRLRTLLVDAMTQATCARLAAHLPGARVVTLRDWKSPDLQHDGWTAILRNGEEWCRVRVRSISTALVKLLEEAFPLPPKAIAWRHRMRLMCAVVVAERRVQVSLLTSLEAGDVILLNGDTRTLDGAAATLCVSNGTFVSLVATGILTGTSLTLNGILRPMDQNVNSMNHATEAVTTLEALEIPLRFEFDTLSISLSELECLAPGYVVTLSEPVSETKLRIVSCGMVIGEACLVSVGGRLGFRIFQLVPRDERR